MFMVVKMYNLVMSITINGYPLIVIGYTTQIYKQYSSWQILEVKVTDCIAYPAIMYNCIVTFQ